MTTQPKPSKAPAKASKKATSKRPVTALPQPSGLPEPPRPLGREGTRLWERIWGMRNRWISEALDMDHVTILCETVDERVALRVRVFQSNDWRDRVALRALDDQVAHMMGALGLNPVERAKLNVGEAPKGRLAELRAARAKG
jgi:hypothetical protein